MFARGACLIGALSVAVIVLSLSSVQSYSCVTGSVRALEPVCTTAGITLPSACIAEYQGLSIARTGPCQDSDPLSSGLHIPHTLGEAIDATLRVGLGSTTKKVSTTTTRAGGSNSFDSSSSGSTSGAGTPDSTVDGIKTVLGRFSEEGFAYVGHAKLIDAAPSQGAPSGFVSRLTVPKDALMGQTVSPGSAPSSAARSAPGTPTYEQQSTRLKIRAVRLSADGAVYLETEAMEVDLSQVTPSGETDVRNAEDEVVASSETGSSPRDEGLSSPPDEFGSMPPDDMSAPPPSETVSENSSSASSSTGGVKSRRRLHAVRSMQRQQFDLDGHAGLDYAGREQVAGGGADESLGLGGQEHGQHKRQRGMLDDSYLADVMAWPYRAIGQLTFRTATSAHICSGTWVSRYDVLTAGHCVFNVSNGVGYRDFTFSPAKVGYSTPDGVIRFSFVTFYRAEYPRIDRDGVNYFDLALIRMTAPTLSYMGIKYSCEQMDYPKTQTCGYPYDRSGYYQQRCDDCYYTSNACNPMVQPINWCYTIAGQSGSPIFDLTDYRILGVLSGGPTQGPYASDFSYWTPIDAIHFTSLTKWMWRPGQPASIPPAAPPTSPPPNLAPFSPEPCEAEGDIRLASPKDVPQGLAGRAEICRNGVWGNICTRQGFNDANAAVFCRQLNYPGGSYLPPGFITAAALEQKIWMEPTCAGNEPWIGKCPSANGNMWNVSAFCSHSSDLYVMCRYTANITGSGIMLENNKTEGFFPCPKDGDVRLLGTGTTDRGRVEFCINGQWGSVCHDGWDDADAAVVCRQLGYPYGIATKGAVANGVSPPGPVSMRIWIQHANCTGSEPGLINCVNDQPLGQTDCSHQADAGVICTSTPPTSAGVPRLVGPRCTQPGALRVASDGLNVTTDVSGRLEVCYAGQWGAVCEVNFNEADARVACSQLGYTRGRVVPADPLNGQPIWMSELYCEGAQTLYDFWPPKLTACRFWGMETVNCTNRLVAGVQCTNENRFAAPSFACSVRGALRLGSGNASNIGRLEICNSGTWGSVSDTVFGPREADIACRQMGFASGSMLPREVVPDGHTDSPVWLEGVNCTGREARLTECGSLVWGNQTASATKHMRDVGLNCVPKILPPLPPAPPLAPPLSPFTCGPVGAVRLAGGLTPGTGMLQLCGDSGDGNPKWGSVCGGSFTLKAARMVCRLMNYKDGFFVPKPYLPSYGYNGLYYSFIRNPTNMPIWRDNFDCIASANDPSECTFEETKCPHSADVALVCLDTDRPKKRFFCASSRTKVRLVAGPSPSQGTLQVCRNGKWGTVCDEGWGDVDALVACKQMGYVGGFAVNSVGRTSNGSIVGPFPVGPPEMAVWLSKVSCLVNATKLSMCKSVGDKVMTKACKTHKQDAGAVCWYTRPAG